MSVTAPVLLSFWTNRGTLEYTLFPVYRVQFYSSSFAGEFRVREAPFASSQTCAFSKPCLTSSRSTKGPAAWSSTLTRCFLQNGMLDHQQDHPSASWPAQVFLCPSFRSTFRLHPWVRLFLRSFFHHQPRTDCFSQATLFERKIPLSDFLTRVDT